MLELVRTAAASVFLYLMLLFELGYIYAVLAAFGLVAAFIVGALP